MSQEPLHPVIEPKRALLKRLDSWSSSDTLPYPDLPHRDAQPDLKYLTCGKWRAHLSWGQPQPDRWVTSNLVAPRTLWLVRLFLLIFAIANLVVLLVYEKYEFFFYLTDWGFLGLTLYYLGAFAMSTNYCWTIKKYPTSLEYPVNYWGYRVHWGWQWFYWIWYESVATFHILIPLVYWPFLSMGFQSSTPLSTYCSIAPHAFTVIMLAIEEVLNRHRLQLSHVVFVLCILLLYLVLTYIIFAIHGHYVYPFLNGETYHGLVALALVGIGVATIIIFVIQVGLHHLRDKWCSRRLRQGSVSQNNSSDDASNRVVPSECTTDADPTFV
ncbi:hypothetical protein IWQ61_010463, partial [Dispira simplex]